MFSESTDCRCTGVSEGLGLSPASSPASSSASSDVNGTLVIDDSNDHVLTMKQNCCPTILLINATSLNKANSLELLNAELVTNNVMVCLVCETWFKSAIADVMCSIPNYYLFRKDRGQKKGGGICIWLRDDLKGKRLSLPSDAGKFFELMAVYCENGPRHIIFYLCYNPPKSRYDVGSLVEHIEADIEYLELNFSQAEIVVAGDFNLLNCDFLTAQCGLSLLCTNATHGNNVLDKIFITAGLCYTAVAYKTCLKTKHYGVLARCCVEPVASKAETTAVKVRVYDLREPFLCKLRAVVAERMDRSWTVSDYPEFLAALKDSILSAIPHRMVSLRQRDPAYLTPAVKMLLKERLRHRRAGRLALADLVAVKINGMIVEANNASLKYLDHKCSANLWKEVNAGSTRRGVAGMASDISPDAANIYFASFSQCMVEASVQVAKSGTRGMRCMEMRGLSQGGSNCLYQEDRNSCVVDAIQVERKLRCLKHTAPGPDEIPSWFYRSCSVEVSTAVASIFNDSLRIGRVPEAWKTAIVTPVPKISNATSLGDYRPISVTSVLSRVAESVIAKDFLLPALLVSKKDNQFAYRPTGSTTSALVFLLHRITHLLETNRYVRCLLVDFSKAFDKVDHEILLQKVSSLPVPLQVVDWIAAFLTCRTQVTKINGQKSCAASISAGVVQGSAVGPVLFSIMIADLMPSGVANEICKYADDASLLVPECTDVGIAEEWEGVKTWALSNKLEINKQKTKEIVFHQPSPRADLNLKVIDAIEQVDSVKLLGVYLANNFKFSIHVRNIITTCNQRFYVLRMLKRKGLSVKCLKIVYTALVLNKITYAISAWAGFLSSSEVSQFNSVLKKAFRYGYTDKVLEFEELQSSTDRKLFEKIQRVGNCLNCILPECINGVHALRSRGHLYKLPNCRKRLHRQSFLVRALFDNV